MGVRFNHKRGTKPKRRKLKMKDWIGIIAGILFVIAITYCLYWVAKTVSYSLFYEDMVMQTVTDMVKKSALN